MQPLSEIRVHPVKLSEFGTTPTGADVYRVVWADSRKSVAYRGNNKLVTDKYQHGAESDLRGKWVLEKWLSAAMYYGMSAEMWNALQKTAPELQQYSPDQQREINRFLDTLSAEMRNSVESQLAQSKPDPIIEPYSHEGEYEFAGIFFKKQVDEVFLRQEIKAHIYRMTHTTDEDRKVEVEVAEEKKEEENDKKFEALFHETLDEAKSAV